MTSESHHKVQIPEESWRVIAGSWKANATPQMPFKCDRKVLCGCSHAILMLSNDYGTHGNEQDSPTHGFQPKKPKTWKLLPYAICIQVALPLVLLENHCWLGRRSGGSSTHPLRPWPDGKGVPTNPLLVFFLFSCLAWSWPRRDMAGYSGDSRVFVLPWNTQWSRETHENFTVGKRRALGRLAKLTATVKEDG